MLTVFTRADNTAVQENPEEAEEVEAVGGQLMHVLARPFHHCQLHTRTPMSAKNSTARQC